MTSKRFNIITPFSSDAPSITQQPQNDSILTDAPYTLEVIVDGAPFPEMVWNRDGETVEYTENVFVSGYDASLVFTTVTNDDGGVYSVSLSNNDGSEESISITLSVTGMSERRVILIFSCGGFFQRLPVWMGS